MTLKGLIEQNINGMIGQIVSTEVNNALGRVKERLPGEVRRMLINGGDFYSVEVDGDKIIIQPKE